MNADLLQPTHGMCNGQSHHTQVIEGKIGHTKPKPRTQRLTPHANWVVLSKNHLLKLEQLLQSESTTPLMQKAGHTAAHLAMAIAPHAKRIWVAAGPGNNGGDGLETALNLHLWGKNVTVSLIGEAENLPPDAYLAWQRAMAAGVKIRNDLPPDLVHDMTCADLCIDALLGLGASRSLNPALSAWVQFSNQLPARILSLDIPTGLHPESGQLLGCDEGPPKFIHAHHTLSFIAAKPGLFMGHGRDACGQIWLNDLQTPSDTRISGNEHPFTADARLNTLQPTPANSHASHKGSHGDIAIVGGETMQQRGMGMTGAALLAASAALHAGAGRVILSLLGESELSNAPPDVMQRTWDQLDLSQLHVVCGCGGGDAIKTVMQAVLLSSAQLVLDADGLNAVTESSQWQQLLRQRGTSHPTVITPHPLEAARLLQTSTTEIQNNRLKAARELAERFNCTAVLKGSGTVIAAPGETPRINTTGNGKLAIGGTGDVLAGLIGAYMARGQNAFTAACQGVARHGLVADQWPEQRTLTASRLASRLC